MNATNLILTTIGVKNTFDIVTGTTKLLTKTTKAIVNNTTHHKDLKTFFEESDLHFKIMVINDYVKKNNYNVCCEPMNELFDKINKIMVDIKIKQDLNQNMKIKYFNYNFDKEINELDYLIKLLDNRFSLMVKTI